MTCDLSHLSIRGSQASPSSSKDPLLFSLLYPASYDLFISSSHFLTSHNMNAILQSVLQQDRTVPSLTSSAHTSSYIAPSTYCTHPWWHDEAASDEWLLIYLPWHTCPISTMKPSRYLPRQPLFPLSHCFGSRACTDCSG